MKRISLILLTVLLVAGGALAQYSNPSKVIGSWHDLSASNGKRYVKAAVFDEVCAFCHVPHQHTNNTDTTVNGSGDGIYPLWNHSLSKQQFTPYTSSSMPLTPDTINGNAGANTTVSALCLSCHDGTVGLNTMYVGVQNAGVNKITGPANYANYSPDMVLKVGGVWQTSGPGYNVPVTMADEKTHDFMVGANGSLAQEHPIAFSYSAAAALNPNLKPVATQASGLRRGLYTAASGGGDFLPLYSYSGTGGGQDYMECGTCHNVHDSDTHRPFLRAENTHSALCLACHGTAYWSQP